MIILPLFLNRLLVFFFFYNFRNTYTNFVKLLIFKVESIIYKKSVEKQCYLVTTMKLGELVYYAIDSKIVLTSQTMVKMV